jgi:cytochrome b6-f complex iron-sulfur subunit
MSCRDCMNRRAFIANSAGLAALAAAIEACGDGTISGVATIVKVANFPGLATVGTLVQVSSFFAAKRLGPDSFDAFSMACTHEGTLLGIVNGQRFDCPEHGSRFDANGAVINGPAQRPLTRLVTSYDPVTDELTIN